MQRRIVTRQVAVSLGFLLFAMSASASELLVTTFLDGRAFKGVEIEVDGKTIGQTGSQGEVTAPIAAGDHVVRAVKNAAPLAEHRFATVAGESAELSISFTDFNTPPNIALEKYVPGQAGAAATGSILVDVKDGDDQPLANATVVIEPGNLQQQTNESGLLEIKLPRGTYTLRIQAPGYEDVVQPDLRVISNVGVAAAVRMRLAAADTASGPSDPNVEEVVVVGTYRPSNQTVQVERTSLAITDAISIDELLKLGDSDVAATLKRLVGVSVTGGRYAVVRGLDGRYISTTFNGDLMPSTDPYRRDTQLDLFTSEILSGIEVQKSFSANLPGDTTGGGINIRTKGAPDKDYTRIGVSVGMVGSVTGKDRLTYTGGDGDRFTYDDGTRELTDLARALATPGQPSNNALARAASYSLPNIFNTRAKNNQPNYGLSAGIGRIFDLDGGDELSVNLVGDYSYDTGAQYDARRARDYANVVDPSRVIGGNPYADVSEGYTTAKLTGYGAVSFKSAADWTLDSKTTFLRDSQNSVRVESGPDTQGDNLLEATTLEWIERGFYGQQLAFSMPVRDKRDQIDVQGGLFRTERYAPDRRRYEFKNDALNSLQRNYSDLQEDTLALGASYSLGYSLPANIESKTKVGVSLNQADRDADVFTLGFSPGFTAADGRNVEQLVAQAVSNGSYYQRNTQPTDPYKAEQTLTAVYVSQEMDLTPQVNVTAGLRREQYELDVEYPFDSLTTVDKVDESKVLPSLAGTYRVGDAWQFRGVYSRTVSRPNITERVRSAYFDDQDRFFLGCAPGAECTTATIDNYDLRAEFYPDEGGSVSAAVFLKEIDNPLEVALAARTAEVRALQFRNSESAKVRGVEFDANRLFKFETWSLDLGGNVAFIRSKVDLSPASIALGDDPGRKLQGQSPFLANLGATFEHFATSQKLTLALNYFDDRIAGLGLGSEPLLLEKGRAIVNVTYGWDITPAISLSGKVVNLLNEAVEYQQGGLLIERYKTGIGASLGLSYAF